MAVPDFLLNTTCDIYRPFGAGSPTVSGVACHLEADFPRGQNAAGTLTWTHRMQVDPGTDIRDGCIRTPGLNLLIYGDGDEVRIPSGGSTRYVVVWVENKGEGTPQACRRVYLMRDTA